MMTKGRERTTKGIPYRKQILFRNEKMNLFSHSFISHLGSEARKIYTLSLVVLNK